MEKSDVSCGLCHSIYNKANKCPRSLPCGHTFCTECLTELFSHRVIRCPEDLSALTTRRASDLPVNFAMLHLALKFPVPCQEHGRPLEYFCLDDKKRVCVDCGLLGTHRNHLIRADEDLKNEFDLRIKVLCDLVEMLKDGRDSTLEELTKANLPEICRLFADKKTELEGKLKQSFQELREKIAIVEQRAIDELQGHYSHIDRLVQQVETAPVNLEQHLNQLKACIGCFVDQIDSYENPFELFDNIDQETDRLLPLGETVLNSLDEIRGVPVALRHYISNLTVDFQPINLEHFCHTEVIEPSDLKKLAPEKPASPSEGQSPAPAPLDEVQFNSLLQEISNESTEEADFTLSGAICDKAVVLAPYLLCNQSLARLRFSGNQLSSTSLSAIFTAIQGNFGLQQVEILNNAIDTPAVDTLIEALKENRFIQMIDLQGCELPQEDKQRLKRLYSDRVRVS